jgi:NTP pyrophosphatase (non-canonical NTP hydrolase)
MMNRREEVLTIFMEECGEAIQAASKIIRFGVDDAKRDDLEREIGDILAMMKLVDEEVGLDQDRILGYAEKKLVKVEQFMTNKRDD